MKILFLILLGIFIITIVLFIYCSLVLASESDRMMEERGKYDRKY